MKKLIIISLIGLLSSSLYSQGISKVKEATDIAWYGLDFSKAKLIGGSVDFADVDAIINRHFESWNVIIITETKKYDISKNLGKNVTPRISKAVELNKQVSAEGLVTYDQNRLSKDDLQNIVSQYQEDEDGMGMLFAVENLDKINSIVRVQIVFFEIRTGKIEYTQFMEGKSKKTVSFRNVWAGGIHKIIKSIKKEYPTWK